MPSALLLFICINRECCYGVRFSWRDRFIRKKERQGLTLTVTSFSIERLVLGNLVGCRKSFFLLFTVILCVSMEKPVQIYPSRLIYAAVALCSISRSTSWKTFECLAHNPQTFCYSLYFLSNTRLSYFELSSELWGVDFSINLPIKKTICEFLKNDNCYSAIIIPCPNPMSYTSINLTWVDSVW